jgi:hypothetical protein
MITKQEALDKGLQFTGHFSNHRHDLDEKMKELKKAGYNIYLVKHDHGYSICGDVLYFLDRDIKELKDQLECISTSKKYCIEKFKEDLNLLKKEKEQCETSLKVLLHKKLIKENNNVEGYSK